MSRDSYKFYMQCRCVFKTEFLTFPHKIWSSQVPHQSKREHLVLSCSRALSRKVLICKITCFKRDLLFSFFTFLVPQGLISSEVPGSVFLIQPGQVVLKTAAKETSGFCCHHVESLEVATLSTKYWTDFKILPGCIAERKRQANCSP